MRGFPKIRTFVRTILSFAALLLFFNAGVAQAQDALFFNGADDIPVMPGTEEASARGFRFDKPGGEIVEVYADIRGFKPSQVLSFYRQTLPQLGWGRVDADSFYRDAQQLDISFSQEAGVHMMRILVRPSL